MRNDAWLRQEVRERVLHLPARLITAELLQVGIITLAQCAILDAQHPLVEAGEAAFVHRARARLRQDLIDEVRCMNRLAPAQRRLCRQVRLARRQAGHRLCLLGELREPSPEEVARVARLDLLEVQVADRLAELGPRDPLRSSRELMARHAECDPQTAATRLARSRTQQAFNRAARAVAAGATSRLEALDRHFGWASAPPQRPLEWIRRVFDRRSPADGGAPQGLAEQGAPDQADPVAEGLVFWPGA